MSSTTTHFTKSFPKRADITGSPKQAFHMLDNHDKYYYKYLLGGISAGTIAALGTIAPGGSFQYLYAPQIYHNLGGEPIGIVGTSSNMIGKFSCIYITLGDFKCFPFVEATASMSQLLKHTDVTPLGGPVEKMCFFQMAPVPPPSVSICSTRCQYDILKVWLKKNDHSLTCGAAKVHIFCVLVTELVTDLFPLGTDPVLVLPRL
jgi:hypothetical protein